MQSGPLTASLCILYMAAMMLLAIIYEIILYFDIFVSMNSIENIYKNRSIGI